MARAFFTVSVLHTEAFRAYLEHAEAVAARLVEVICEQEGNARWWMNEACHQREQMQAERDAARAEVAALRDLIPHVYGMGRDDEAASLPMRELDISALIDGAKP